MNRNWHREYSANGRCIVALLSVAISLAAWTSTGAAPTVFLDADTPATGSNLGSQPLVTSLGTITFIGELRDKDGDPEFDAAGALGNVFDIGNANSSATMTFNFDVQSITFIYGGNFGVFDIVARNINGVTVDSFFQASTDSGQPAGPHTLSGAAIRSIFWQDPTNAFAPIDNVTIEGVPEPTSVLLVAIGLFGPSLCVPRRTKRR
jgi:hypothetical protein